MKSPSCYGIYTGDPYEQHRRRQSLTCVARMLAAIQESRSTLRIIYGGRASQSFDKGQPFDVYDELRKKIETAQTDALFVDRYMGADFVSRYPPSVRAGVSIRLLTRDLILQLVAAVEAFVQQHGAKIPQSLAELRRLLEFPTETLSLEQKSWLDLTDTKARATLAKAAFAQV